MRCDSCRKRGARYFVDGSDQWGHYTWWDPMIVVLCGECAAETSYDTPEEYASFLDEQLFHMEEERDTYEDKLEEVRDLKKYMEDLALANREEG